MKRIEDREEAERRQRESNREAVRKYQEKFKRINCRFEKSLYERIEEAGKISGLSANAYIIEAVQEKLSKDQTIIRE